MTFVSFLEFGFEIDSLSFFFFPPVSPPLLATSSSPLKQKKAWFYSCVLIPVDGTTILLVGQVKIHPELILDTYPFLPATFGQVTSWHLLA